MQLFRSSYGLSEHGGGRNSISAVLHDDLVSRVADLDPDARSTTKCRSQLIYALVFEPIRDSVTWKRSVPRAL